MGTLYLKQADGTVVPVGGANKVLEGDSSDGVGPSGMSAGQLLYDADVAAGASRIGVVACRAVSTSSSISTGSWQKPTLSSFEVNEGGWTVFDDAYDNKLVVPEDGTYWVTMAHDHANLGPMIMSIDGANSSGWLTEVLGTTGGNRNSGSRLLQFQAGDLISLDIYNRGATANCIFSVEVIRIVGEPLSGTIVTPPWIEPSSLLNSWEAHSTQYGDLAYRKINDVVYFKGLVKSGTINENIFNLPVGFRPAHDHILSTLSNNHEGRVTVRTDGDVEIPTPSTNEWVSFTNLSFPTTDNV